MHNLPFLEEILADLRRFAECVEDNNDVNLERSRFDLLVQLGLLERVQRSPARWMMTQAGEDAIAQPAAGELAPYVVGNQYRTQAGDLVRFVAVHNEGKSYETMEDESGVSRYTRRDSGRVTGTAHDYSDPRNTPPLWTAPPAAVSVGASEPAAPRLVLPTPEQVMHVVMRFQWEDRKNGTGTTNWAANLGMAVVEYVARLNKVPPAAVQKGAPVQYRLLRLGEVILETDELLMDDCATWQPMIDGPQLGIGREWHAGLVPMRRSDAAMRAQGDGEPS